MKHRDSILAGLLIVVLGLGLVAGISAIEAYLLKVMWNWVIVDTLHLAVTKLPFLPAWLSVVVLNVFLAKFKTTTTIKK
jgi:hypothetical protein